VRADVVGLAVAAARHMLSGSATSARVWLLLDGDTQASARAVRSRRGVQLGRLSMSYATRRGYGGNQVAEAEDKAQQELLVLWRLLATGSAYAAAAAAALTALESSMRRPSRPEAGSAEEAADLEALLAPDPTLCDNALDCY
jgi:hypothetical protein